MRNILCLQLAEIMLKQAGAFGKAWGAGAKALGAGGTSKAFQLSKPGGNFLAPSGTPGWPTMPAIPKAKTPKSVTQAAGLPEPQAKLKVPRRGGLMNWLTRRRGPYING